MRRYEATTLDFYDDGGIILKESIPDLSDLPDFVKTAATVDDNSHNSLFALILVEDGNVMKKFATADRGNTWLSTLYFAHTCDSLPIEAQKIAASNLIEACQHFRIDIPEFLYDLSEGPVDTNIVDISSLNPPMQKAASQKEEIKYAIEREDGSKFYPLKDASTVKVATAYFDENHRRLAPKDRRQFAVKVASEAKKGALPIPDSMAKYASENYSPNVEGHLTTRFLHLTQRDAPAEVKDRLIKVARMRAEVPPEEFALALERFDLETGLDALWDRDVADPWYSTFATEKIAKGAAFAPKSYPVYGEASVTEAELMRLLESGRQLIVDHFGEAIANAMEREGPGQIFESLPLPQKRTMARLAASYHPVG